MSVQDRLLVVAAVLAYLPTRLVERQAESREALRILRALEGDRVLRTSVPLATAVAQSLAEAASLFSPRYHRSKGPAAYLAVVEEVAKLLEERHG